MIARMIVTGLLALSLSSILPIYSADMAPTPQAMQPSQANIQPPQPGHTSKALRIFIEEDFSTAQMLKRELTDWSFRIGIPIIFVEKGVEPYDLRIILASGVGSDSGSCSSSCTYTCTDISCTPSPSSCNVTVTLYFASASALTPDGKLQFTETGVGSAKTYAITPLARKWLFGFCREIPQDIVVIADIHHRGRLNANSDRAVAESS
jgi:hypothetical protein